MLQGALELCAGLQTVSTRPKDVASTFDLTNSQRVTFS